MKMVQPFLLRGVLIPALATLVACTGTRVEDASPANETKAAATEKPVSPAPTPTQDTQGVAQDRQKVFIETTLKEARRSMDLKLWNDAARLAAQVLDIEPSNKEAREILFGAQDLLGGAREKGIQQTIEDKVLQQRFEAERARFQAEEKLRVGDAHLEAGRYEQALESYGHAQLILRYSPAIAPGSELERMLEIRVADAGKAKLKAEQERTEARRLASQKELAEAERKQRANVAAKVKNLMEAANTAFLQGNYQRAVALLDEVLHMQPTNANASALRDLAERARHENAIENLRVQWRTDWVKTFDELNSSDVVQTDSIKFDLERWRTVSQRTPLKFTPTEDVDTPEEKAILDKLESTKIEHKFAKAEVDNWAAYYASVTELNFVVTAPVKEMDPATTTLNDLVLPPMSVRQALDIIGSMTGVKWRIQNGLVQLVAGDKAIGKTFLKPYEVRDIIQGVKDRPAKDLKLKIPGEEDPAITEDEEAKPSVVDGNKLMDLIKSTIEPTSWEGGEASITEHKGVLMIKQTREVHGRLESFFTDLRQAVGIEVDVEARFLKVADNFLEDVGVDFRGLGNQASEGVPGRGLEQNNRQNAGFDDFGRRENTNAATPGEIGTGTEPGFFYDDGQDGDIMGRTEHLYDRTLGGRNGALDNAGGLSLQYAFLDDAQLEVILRAVAKRDRSEEITAPRLLVYNNKRAHMQVLRHTSYIQDFDVEIAQAAAVANPKIDVVRDGVVLDVRPVVSADRKFVTLELRPTVLTLQLPIPTFTTTLGVGQPISIQLPSVTRQSVRTTVTIPDGGTILLGGMSLAAKQNMQSGVPILKDIPIISFLFSRKGTFTQNERVVILLRTKIMLVQEHEPTWMPQGPESLMIGPSGTK